MSGNDHTTFLISDFRLRRLMIQDRSLITTDEYDTKNMKRSRLFHVFYILYGKLHLTNNIVISWPDYSTAEKTDPHSAVNLPACWWHKKNSADPASRGVLSSGLIHSSLWWLDQHFYYCQRHPICFDMSVSKTLKEIPKIIYVTLLWQNGIIAIINKLNISS